MKLSKVTRPVRSKALDLRLSVSKAPVSRQRRAESGQGQQRDEMTKMETTEKDRGVLDEGRAGSTAGVGPGSSLHPPRWPGPGSLSLFVNSGVTLGEARGLFQP